jgi:hypothetical protein
MAQVADLKDPSTSNTEPVGNADEVLSQLAGSEIDRLLAEADVATTPEPASVPASAAATPTPSAPDLRQVAAVESELGLDEAALTSQLDELFNQLQEETTAKAAQAEQTAVAEPPAAAVDPAPTPEAAVVETPPTEGAERAALLEAAGFESEPKPVDAAPAQSAPAPAPAPAAQAPPPPAPSPAAHLTPAATPSAEASERSAVLDAAGFESVEFETPTVPFWIKPFEWINAPIEHCSPAVRQAMGRAAIVTLVNAILVLSYLAISHHH